MHGRPLARELAFAVALKIALLALLWAFVAHQHTPVDAHIAACRILGGCDG